MDELYGVAVVRNLEKTDRVITVRAVLHCVSGIHVMYNLSKPVGARVMEAWVRCAHCDVPEYEPLKDGQSYDVLTSGFLIGGGDGYTMLEQNVEFHLPYGKAWQLQHINISVCSITMAATRLFVQQHVQLITQKHQNSTLLPVARMKIKVFYSMLGNTILTKQ